MSDPEPPDAPRRLLARRRVRFGVVAGAVALALVAVLLVTMSRGSEQQPALDDFQAAPRKADPVAVGRVVEKAPPNCGVTDRTALRLAPGAKRNAEKGSVFRPGGPGSCQWYSLDDGKAKCDWCAGDFSNERVLNVEIKIFEGGERASPIGEAMDGLGDPRNTDAQSPNPAKAVEGLGEEATVYYSAETETEGALVVFRVGNAVTSVKYKGWDAVGRDRRTISEKTAMDGALAVAAETAKSLGTAARPTVTEAARSTAPPRRVAKPCDLVPADTVAKIVRDATRKRDSAALIASAPEASDASETCTWPADSPERDETKDHTLSVTVWAPPDWRPGEAARAASRRYLKLHHDVRADKAADGKRYTRFTALTGPGDQAFAAARSVSGSGSRPLGLVVFRAGGVLVEVACGGPADGVRDRPDQLINGAHAAAVAAAGRLT